VKFIVQYGTWETDFFFWLDARADWGIAACTGQIDAKHKMLLHASPNASSFQICLFKKLRPTNLSTCTICLTRASRGKIERNISLVAQNLRTKEEVLLEAVQHFSGDFQEASRQKGAFVSSRLTV